MTQIHWLTAVSGPFGTAADWSTRTVPGPGDDAILDAPGSAFTVSATQSATVNSIQTSANALLDIQANFAATSGTGAGANDGAIRIENGDTLTLQGTVANVGTMELFGTVSTTSIVLGSSGVTLTGGGAVFLNFTGGTLQQIVPSPNGSVLTDVNDRISGQGLLGGPGLTIISESEGFLEAKGGSLIINTGANTIVNAGLIDAEGAPGDGGLPPGLGTVESPINNSGIVKADGVGSIMEFDDAVTGSGRAVISGGTLRFDSAFNQDVAFEGASGVLQLAQSMNYTSVIQGFATTGAESLDLGDIAFMRAGEATYSGTTSGGVLTVTDGTHRANIHFEGDYAGWVFGAVSDGHGGTSVTTWGPRALHWINPVSGLFQTGADWTGGAAPGFGNDAILDAPGSSVYTVTASASQTVAGVQTAANATLSIAGAFVASEGTDEGVNAGGIAIANGGTFTVAGTLANVGHITMGAASGRASLMVTGSALTLSGGGTVALSNSNQNIIEGASAATTLTNLNNQITGAGDVGGGKLTLVNQAAGIIDANASTSLIVDTGGQTITNAGLLEATGSGGLSLRSAVNNAGGVIAAAGGSVFLQGADILGGTLSSTGGKIIYAKSGVNTLDGTASAVNVQCRVLIDNGENLNLAGALDNTATGLIDIASDGTLTTLTIGAAGASLTGTGEVYLGNDTPAAEVIGAASTSTLDNLSNVIAGAGDLGGGRMTLVNGPAGIILGEYAVALIVDTGANTIVNAGRIENSGQGGTIVQSAVANSGALIAEGGTLTLNGAVTGSGEALIYAGALDFASSFSQNVAFKATSGMLELAQSQGFAATVYGFSTTGGTSLDLRDIAFGGSTKATYSGATSGGLLTVTDGTHTAHIQLSGNYLSSTFTASSDGHGGTTIIDPTAAPATTTRPHAFIAAMAHFGAPSAGSGGTAFEMRDARPSLLAIPCQTHGAPA